MFVDGRTTCHPMDYGVKPRFPSTGISVVTSCGLNIMFQSAKKYGSYYAEHRLHNNTAIPQRAAPFIMCLLNYYVCIHDS